MLTGLVALGSLVFSGGALAANGGSMTVCAEDGTGTMFGTSGSFTSTSNCDTSPYEWGIFSDTNPDGSTSGGNQTSLTGNKDGTMSFRAVNGLKMLSTMDMGNNKITGLANGTASQDAATFGQLMAATKYFHTNSTLADSSATGADAIAIGPQATASASGSIAMGNGATASVANTIAMGNAASSSGYNSIAVGLKAQASNYSSIAIGESSSASGAYSVAIGDQSSAMGTQSVALGYGAVAGDGLATAFGNIANASGYASSAFGNNANASGLNATAFGNNSKASGVGTVAMGSGANASADNAMALGRKSVAASNAGDVALGYNSVTSAVVNTTGTTIGGTDYTFAGTNATSTLSVGALGQERTITNVAAGRIGASSTDAVNGSQLFATNQQVTQNTGDITALNTNVAQNTTDVSNNTTSISQLDQRVTTNEGDIRTINGSITTINGQLADAVMYDSASHDKVTLGNAGTPVQLGNVKAGGLSTDSLDAVNGSQLYATNQQVAQNTGDIAGNTASITNLDGRVTTVEGDITNINKQINSGSIGLVQQSAAGANLTVGKNTDGAAVDFAGTTGTRKLVNVADGAVAAGSKEAVNGGQLFGVSQSVANAIGGGSTVNSDGSISAPSYTVTKVDGSTTTVNNVGDAITNLDNRTFGNTTAISNLAQTINNITNNGAGIKYFHANSNLADSVASGVNAVSIGGNAKASATNAVAVGSGAQATQANSVALGSDSTTEAVTATKGGMIAGTDYAYAGSTPTGTVSVGSAGSERTVSNVAAGQVSATSTDAVNGSQLYATNQAVNQLDGRMGNVENNLSNVTNTVNTITNAVTNGQSGMFQVSADSNSTQPVASGTRSTAGGNGAIASGSASTAVGNDAQAKGNNSVAIGADSVADRDNTVSVGSAGKERQVTHVAAGKADTDAVNVSQLKSAGIVNNDGSSNKVVTYDNTTDGTSSVTLNSGGDPTIIRNVAAGQLSSDAATVGQVNDAMQSTANWAKNYTDRQVANISRQARAGSAAAIAVASLPQAYQPSQNSVGVAFGTYQGQSAVSVGMSAISENGRYIVKFSATGAQHSGAGAGIGAGMVW